VNLAQLKAVVEALRTLELYHFGLQFDFVLADPTTVVGLSKQGVRILDEARLPECILRTISFARRTP
jgi:hypothetical protein